MFLTPTQVLPKDYFDRKQKKRLSKAVYEKFRTSDPEALRLSKASSKLNQDFTRWKDLIKDMIHAGMIDAFKACNMNLSNSDGVTWPVNSKAEAKQYFVEKGICDDVWDKAIFLHLVAFEEGYPKVFRHTHRDLVTQKIMQEEGYVWGPDPEGWTHKNMNCLEGAYSNFMVHYKEDLFRDSLEKHHGIFIRTRFTPTIKNHFPQGWKKNGKTGIFVGIPSASNEEETSIKFNDTRIKWKYTVVRASRLLNQYFY